MKLFKNPRLKWLLALILIVFGAVSNSSTNTLEASASKNYESIDFQPAQTDGVLWSGLDCEALNVMYLIDTSGSMQYYMNGVETEDPPEDFENSKMFMANHSIARINEELVNIIPEDHLSFSLAQFNSWRVRSDNTNIVQTWTDDVAEINSKVEALTGNGMTNMPRGFQLANALADAAPSTGSTVLIFISDGMPSETLAGESDNSDYPEVRTETFAEIDQFISDHSTVPIISVGIGSEVPGKSGFDPEFLEYTASESVSGAFIPIESQEALEAEEALFDGIIDYFESNCVSLSADLEPTIDLYPAESLDKVKLEELAIYEIGLKNNESLTAIPHTSVRSTKLELILQNEPMGMGSILYTIEIVENPDFECVNTSDNKITCTSKDDFSIAPGEEIYVATVTVRVGGKHFPDQISASVRSYAYGITDIDPTNDTQYATLGIRKMWNYLSHTATNLKLFTHVKYDQGALAFSSAYENLEYDYYSNEYIVSPFQAPIWLSVGASVENYPKLVAEYCYDAYDSTTFELDPDDLPNSHSCSDDEHVILGAFLFENVTFDQYDLVANTGGVLTTVETTELENADGSAVTMELGQAKNGKFANLQPEDSSLDVGAGCSDHINDHLSEHFETYSHELGSDAVPNCMEYARYHSSSMHEDLAWNDHEYVLVSFNGNGGRNFDCGTSASRGFEVCITNENAAPGIYKFTGSLSGNAVFRDDIRLKSLDDPIYGDYVATISTSFDYHSYVKMISTFIEPEIH